MMTYERQRKPNETREAGIGGRISKGREDAMLMRWGSDGSMIMIDDEREGDTGFDFPNVF